ncbi:MAG: DUF5686 family protein [Bacteroidota bacterium]
MLLPFLLIGRIARAQQSGETIPVGGIVTDSATGGSLGFVTVRVEGTTKGRITTAQGTFLLRLPPGSYVLAFSSIGYRKERREIIVRKDSVSIAVALASAPFQAVGVVVAAEDPGVSLMRKVIRRKGRMSDSLESYGYMLYTKFVASTDTLTAGRSSRRNDTTIVSIFESYSKGYYRKSGNYFNEIIQRRQTVNIPAESNLVAFGTNLNAYDDAVEILGESIATPFHPDALNFYDFVLERSTRTEDSTVINRVRVTPKSNGRKLFSGYIDIDSIRAVPLYVDLRPNRAVELPFDAELTYQQKFEEADGRFVVPSGMRIHGSAQASIFWIIAPRLDIDIETIAYDYEPNAPLPADIFSRRRVEVNESADHFDSAYWTERAVLPLRPEESAAYEDIRRAQDNPDSVEGSGFLEKALGEIPRVIGKLSRRPFSGLDDIFRYNRVTGAYFGVGMIGEVLPNIEGSAKGGFGTADKRWYGELGVRGWFDRARIFSAWGEAYRRLARRDNPYAITSAAITPIALLTRSDYGDYFHADGFTVGLEAGIGQLRQVRRELFVHPTMLRLFFRNEDQSTAGNHATFALFGGDKKFRDNPPAIDGTMRSFGFELDLNYSSYRRLGGLGAQIGGEISEPSIIPSGFAFRQLYGSLVLKRSTLPLWTLDMRLGAGISAGTPPPQRFFSLESAVSSVAADAAFRGMGVKEFYGDRYVALSLEHNFGEVIPGVLRIPNIASFGIEFIALGRIGWTAFSPATLAYTGTTLGTTDATADRYYYEAGIGLNRILLFFRFDLSARLSQTEKPKFIFTISGATF